MPDCPPVAIVVQLPLPELELLEELELLLELDEELLDDDELVEELLLEDELEELLLDDELELLEVPPTVIVKPCVVCAPQLLVWTAVATQEAAMLTVCSRAVPAVPQPLQFQEPPVTGCGPNCTVLPAATVAVAVCCQLPPFTAR